MSGPAFLITRIDDARDAPQLARDLLRNGLGSDTIREAVQVANAQDSNLAQIGADGSMLTIDDDAAFLMIGNTDELYDACKATTASSSSSDPPPLWNMQTATGRPLTYHHARIKVSPIQTDTVLMVASGQYWGYVNPLQSGWTKSQNQPTGALVQFFDNGQDPSIPRVVRQITG